MTGDFDIQIDEPRALLRVRMWGFYTEADVVRYHRAITAASDRLPIPPREQRMLSDISDMKIQSQAIVAAFQRVMADARYRDRRVGFVAVSSLARAHLSRVIGSRTARIFGTVADAEAWLFTPETTARAA